ncbi:MAG TPA: ATP-binding protein [Myxococcota bacterium]
MRLITYCGLLAVAAIAASVIAAACFGTRDLQQLALGGGPIRPVVAGGLLACALGAVLAPRGPALARFSNALGAGALALGAASLAQTVLRVPLPDLGIVRAAAAGLSMPPNSAIALGLAASAVLCLRRLPSAGALLAGLSAAIGATALLGYATGIEPAYGWARLEGMAPGTAACLVLLGTVLWSLASARASAGESDGSLALWRGPVVAGVATLSVSLLFAQALREREEDFLRTLVALGARRAEAELRSGLSERSAPLATLSHEWESRWIRSRTGWESDVRLLMARAPELRAIEWIDARGNVWWSFPEDARLPAPRVGEPGEPRSGVFFSPPQPLDGSAACIRALAPMRDSDGSVNGWVSGVFDASQLLGTVLADLDSSFSVSVSTRDGELFRTANADGPEVRRPISRRRLVLSHGLDLRVRVEPSRDLLAATRSSLPQLSLFAGLVVSSLLTLSLGMRALAVARTRALAREALAREAAAEEVSRLNTELEVRVLARTAELTHSNEELRQFASFLSHELRQPLSAQGVWADLLETKHGAALDEEGKRCVAQLRSGSARMAELLDAQLALARSDRRASAGEAVDLEPIARAVLADLEPVLREIGGRVDVGALPVVRGERHQLEQLLRNLLENAIKYRSLAAPLRIRIRGVVEGADALLSVEDNGRGFPLADAERIFEPAVRLEPDDGGGQGLGLALCRQIAAGHGGWIRARGSPGGGAVFTVLLPASPRPGDSLDRRVAPG